MTATPRVLWLTNDLPPRSGGIEQFVGNLLAMADPATTRVLASRWPGDVEADSALPCEVRRIARRPLLPGPALLRRVRAEIREHAADVVVLGAAWPLGELAGRLAVPTVALTHGHEAGIARVGGGRVVAHALRDLAAVGVISEFAATGLRPWLPPGVAVHHVPPGVDVEAFSPGADGARVRRRHGIAADQPLVVCVSRLVRRKGQDALVTAWPRVVARIPDAHLLLAGTGPLAARLVDQVSAAGLGGRVTLTGEVAWDELPAHHRAGDVFAMPCRTRWGGLDVEGLGIVYLEAQACGTPVVAGRSGGAPEAVVDGETGLVVDGRDPGAIADALCGLLGDAPRRAAMGTAGRAFVAERYAWRAVGDRFAEMITAAADKGKPG